VPLQGVTFRVGAVVPTIKASFEPLPGDGRRYEPVATRSVAFRHLSAEQEHGGEYERDALAPGAVVHGPAVVREALSTTFVPAGHTLTVGELGELVITLEEAS
jgi:N-methylhydantoinase A